MTRTTIDHTRMGARRATRAKNLNATLDNIMIDVEDAIEEMFNSRDPHVRDRLNDALIILGCRDGELKTVGTGDTPDDASTRTLKGYVQAYEHDGTPLGTGFKTEDDAKAAGFEPWLETDGSLKGWRKPLPAAIAAPPDTDLPVHNTKDQPTGKKMSLKDAEADSTHYEVIVVNGKPDHIKERPHGFSFGRGKSH